MSATTKIVHSLSSDRVKGLDIHPMKPWVAVSTFKGTVCIYNHRTGMKLKEIRVSQDPVRCVRFIPGHPWVVCGCDDRMIRCYDYNTQARVASFKAHEDYVRALWVYEESGETILASSGDDCVIRLWLVSLRSTWPLLGTYGGHVQMALSLCALPRVGDINISKVISAGYDGRICVHEATSYQQSPPSSSSGTGTGIGTTQMNGVYNSSSNNVSSSASMITTAASAALTAITSVTATAKKLTNKGAKRPIKILGLGIPGSHNSPNPLGNSLGTIASALTGTGNVGRNEEFKKELNVIRPMNIVSTSGELFQRGTKVITGGDDTRVIIWDIGAGSTSAPLCSLCSHVDNVTDVCALSFNGEQSVNPNELNMEQDPTASYYAYLNQDSNGMGNLKNKNMIKTVIISCSEDGTVVGNLIDSSMIDGEKQIDSNGGYNDENEDNNDLLFKCELGLGRCWCLGVIGDKVLKGIDRQKYGQITLCVGCDRGLAIIRVKMRGKSIISPPKIPGDQMGDNPVYIGESPKIILNRPFGKMKGNSACKCMVVGSVDDEFDTVFIGGVIIHGNHLYHKSNSEMEKEDGKNENEESNTLLLDRINCTYIIPSILLMNNGVQNDRKGFKAIYTATNREGDGIRSVKGGLIKGAHFGGSKYILIEEKLKKKALMNGNIQQVGLTILSALSYRTRGFISEHDTGLSGKDPQPILCGTLLGESLVYITKDVNLGNDHYMLYLCNFLSNGSTEVISSRKISNKDGDIPISIKLIRSESFTGIAIFYNVADGAATALRLFGVNENCDSLTELKYNISTCITLPGNFRDMSIYETEEKDGEEDRDLYLSIWGSHNIHTVNVDVEKGEAKLISTISIQNSLGRVDSVSMVPIEEAGGNETKKIIAPMSVFSTSTGKILGLVVSDGGSNHEIIPIASCGARGILIPNNSDYDHDDDNDNIDNDTEEEEKERQQQQQMDNSKSPDGGNIVSKQTSISNEEPSDFIISDALHHPGKYRDSNILLSEDNLQGGAGLLLVAACVSGMK